MPHRAFLFASAMFLVACGSSGGVSSHTRDDPTAKLEAEDLAPALNNYLDRLVRRIDSTATQLDQLIQTTAVRRRTLQLRIRAATMAQDVRHRPNSLVALIEAWHWATALDIHSSGEKIKAVYGENVGILLATTAVLRQEVEALSHRALAEEKFTAMRADIVKAVGNDALFAPTADEHPELLEQFLSATHLESILALPLSPFTALNGVGRGADAVGALVKVADRGVDLAELYPQILAWQLQLVLVEVEERQITQQVVGDLHIAAQAAASVADTAKALPSQIRQETVALLEQSQGVQVTAQQTLKDAQQAASAIDDAARSIDQGVRSLDTFIAGLKPKGEAPEPTGGEPFRIRDYTAAAIAITGAVKELNMSISSIEHAATSPAIIAQSKATADYAGSVLTRAIDHLAWRASQIVVLAIAGGAVSIGFLRRRHLPSGDAPAASSSRTAPWWRPWQGDARLPIRIGDIPGAQLNTNNRGSSGRLHDQT